MYNNTFVVFGQKHRRNAFVYLFIYAIKRQSRIVALPNTQHFLYIPVQQNSKFITTQLLSVDYLSFKPFSA